MQHVLIIGAVWPEPVSSAAGGRTLQLVDLFYSQGWKISFASAARQNEFMPDLKKWSITTYPIAINDSAFDELLKELQPDVVMFDRFATEEQFGWRVSEHCPRALKILDTIDLHCLRTARHKALKENRAFNSNNLLSEEISLREIASIYRCDISLMISSFEMKVLQEVFKVLPALIHYTPFMPDGITEKESSAWPGFEKRTHFVTIGNFLHEPNRDSVLYLKNTIWPLLRKKISGAQLLVYGAYAAQREFDLHKPSEGFIVKGRADNVNQVMLNARICLAPLRFGAGMKGKLLDAMLCGTPSVTSSVGAEAMHGNLDWSGAVEDDATAFVEKASRLYSDKAAWTQAQKNGISIINQVFNKTPHGQALLKKINDTLANLHQHRRNNFMGNLLQSRQFAANKYMSLWIEQKNRAK